MGQVLCLSRTEERQKKPWGAEPLAECHNDYYTIQEDKLFSLPAKNEGRQLATFHEWW
jgi:hypothetical protein